MKYGKGFKVSFTTVAFLIALGFIFSILSYRPQWEQTVGMPSFSPEHIKILEKYLDCEPFIGYDGLYRVWREEAKTALNMGISAGTSYRARLLAQAIAPRVSRSPRDSKLVEFAYILVLREDLIEWYEKNVDREKLLLFKASHVGYLRWVEDGKCVDYSFLPRSYLPYKLRGIDIDETWRKAHLLGLVISGYVDGLFIERVILYKQSLTGVKLTSDICK